MNPKTSRLFRSLCFFAVLACQLPLRATIRLWNLAAPGATIKLRLESGALLEIPPDEFREFRPEGGPGNGKVSYSLQVPREEYRLPCQCPVDARFREGQWHPEAADDGLGNRADVTWSGLEGEVSVWVFRGLLADSLPVAPERQGATDPPGGPGRFPFRWPSPRHPGRDGGFDGRALNLPPPPIPTGGPGQGATGLVPRKSPAWSRPPVAMRVVNAYGANLRIRPASSAPQAGDVGWADGAELPYRVDWPGDGDAECRFTVREEGASGRSCTLLVQVARLDSGPEPAVMVIDSSWALIRQDLSSSPTFWFRRPPASVDSMDLSSLPTAPSLPHPPRTVMVARMVNAFGASLWLRPESGFAEDEEATLESGQGQPFRVPLPISGEHVSRLTVRDPGAAGRTGTLRFRLTLGASGPEPTLELLDCPWATLRPDPSASIPTYVFRRRTLEGAPVPPPPSSQRQGRGGSLSSRSMRAGTPPRFLVSPTPEPPSQRTSRRSGLACQFPGCGHEAPFDDAARLAEHVQEHRLGMGQWHCPRCGKKSKSTHYHEVHVRTHTGEKPHLCPHPGCPKAFNDLYVMKKHVSIHHEPEAEGPDSEPRFEQSPSPLPGSSPHQAEPSRLLSSSSVPSLPPFPPPPVPTPTALPSLEAIEALLRLEILKADLLALQLLGGSLLGQPLPQPLAQPVGLPLDLAQLLALAQAAGSRPR